MKWVSRHLLIIGALCGCVFTLTGAERIPPAPSHYFNDYANVVSPRVAEELNATLDQFERTTSNQLVVAIFPRMESDSSVEDYTVRVAQAWKVGQQDRKNGAVLFAFMQEHQVYIQVGYGLEGVIPDATAKRIISNEIVPRFRQGDVDGGMRAAVQAMIAATRGEYKGTGQTRNDSAAQDRPAGLNIGITVIFIILMIIISRRRSHRTYVFGGPRGGWWMGPPGGGGSGGWTSGGGSSGGGGFTGGGGSFGGGGAGGKW